MARLPEVGSSLYPNSLTVEHSLFFDPKVYFPALRKLHIKSLRNLKEIWNSQLSPNSFCELTDLEVKNCDNLLHLGPTHMQNRLHKLETIWVENCSSPEEIFEVRRLNVNEGDASTISQSKKISSSISQPDQGMQINNIMDFKQSRQSFQNLTSLKVTRCHSLRYLLSPSIARGLVRLERLYIRGCEKIEEIVAAAKGDEKEDGSILPRLKQLDLWDLPALRYVWKVESHTGCLGNLAHIEKIDVWGCQSLEAIFGLVGSGHHEEDAALEINFLSLTLKNLPSFAWISNSNYKGMASLPEVSSLYLNNLTVEHSLFFDPKVCFPVLRSLTISGLDNLKEIWNSQLSPNSFCELTDLDVKNCNNLLHLGPTHIQNRLQKLETIQVENCSSLEEIFEIRRLNVNEGYASTISQSKKILSSISQPDQGMQINNIMEFKHSRQGFQNLTSLRVIRCHSLRYLLSPSIARSLVRLERLYIEYCEKIEEIVAAAEGEEKEDESILPRLQYLELQQLPNLGSFSQGKYTFEWPLLVRIVITFCSKMNNFCFGSLNIPREVHIFVYVSGKNLGQELKNCRKEI